LTPTRDGVWLVELASLADPALVPQAVAAVLRVREEPGRPLVQTLTEALHDGQMRLVLDNTAWAAGRAMLPDQAITDALAYGCHNPLGSGTL
jgi:predicted ATPase